MKNKMKVFTKLFHSNNKAVKSEPVGNTADSNQPKLSPTKKSKLQKIKNIKSHIKSKLKTVFVHKKNKIPELPPFPEEEPKKIYESKGKPTLSQMLATPSFKLRISQRKKPIKVILQSKRRKCVRFCHLMQRPLRRSLHRKFGTGEYDDSFCQAEREYGCLPESTPTPTEYMPPRHTWALEASQKGTTQQLTFKSYRDESHFQGICQDEEYKKFGPTDDGTLRLKEQQVELLRKKSAEFIDAEARSARYTSLLSCLKKTPDTSKKCRRYPGLLSSDAPMIAWMEELSNSKAVQFSLDLAKSNANLNKVIEVPSGETCHHHSIKRHAGGRKCLLSRNSSVMSVGGDVHASPEKKIALSGRPFTVGSSNMQPATRRSHSYRSFEVDSGPGDVKLTSNSEAKQEKYPSGSLGARVTFVNDPKNDEKRKDVGGWSRLSKLQRARFAGCDVAAPIGTKLSAVPMVSEELCQEDVTNILSSVRFIEEEEEEVLADEKKVEVLRQEIKELLDLKIRTIDSIASTPGGKCLNKLLPGIEKKLNSFDSELVTVLKRQTDRSSMESPLATSELSEELY